MKKIRLIQIDKKAIKGVYFWLFNVAVDDGYYMKGDKPRVFDYGQVEDKLDKSEFNKWAKFVLKRVKNFEHPDLLTTDNMEDITDLEEKDII